MLLVSKPHSGPKDQCVWMHKAVAIPLEKIEPELSRTKRVDAILRNFLKIGLQEQIAILRSAADAYIVPDSKQRTQKY